MLRFAEGILDLTGKCFTSETSRQMDQKVIELKKLFPEAYSIERVRQDGETFIKVQFVDPKDSTRDLLEIETRMRKAVGNLPVRFERITFNSISKLFAGLAALAQRNS